MTDLISNYTEDLNYSLKEVYNLKPEILRSVIYCPL
jgi:hypothetical protein